MTIGYRTLDRLPDPCIGRFDCPGAHFIVLDDPDHDITTDERCEICQVWTRVEKVEPPA